MFFPQTTNTKKYPTIYQTVMERNDHSQVPVNRSYMCVNFMSSNSMNFFSIDTLFLVSIYDYNILQILYIKTFPKNASYFPNNAFHPK